MNRPALLVTVLAVALAVRLYHIDAPLIGFGSWRQCDTAAMARNFATGGHRILYPQIDWAGDGPGFVETEFPIFPFLVSGLYRLFGVHDWLGRLLASIMSVFSVLGLYLLVEELIDKKTAIWAAGLLAVLPLSVYYGRSFMNEPMLLACSIFGLYFFARWMSTGRARYGVVSATLVALACLIKLPTLYLGLPLLYLALSKRGIRALAQPGLWLFAVAVLAPVAVWYYHAHQTYLQYGMSFGIWEYGADKWGNWSRLVSPRYWNRVLFQYLGERHLAWFGIPLLLLGLFSKRESPRETLFDLWMIALVVYLIIVANGNFEHDYYQIPFLAPIAVFMAKVLARHLSPPLTWSWRQITLGLLLAGMLGLGTWRHARLLQMEDPEKSAQIALARLVHERTEKEALVVAVDEHNPTLLYHFERKGWHADPGEVDDRFLAERAGRGARYLVGLRDSFRKPDDSRRLAALLVGDGATFTADGRGFLLRLSP